jgi:hypothetical protein
MTFTLVNDENYRQAQRDLAALGPQAVAIIKRYLEGAPASEIPTPMIQAAYDVLDRLGLVRQHHTPVFPPFMNATEPEDAASTPGAAHP